VIALERKTWHAQSSGGRVPGWIGALTLLPVMSEAHGTARPGSRERGRWPCGGWWRTSQWASKVARGRLPRSARLSPWPRAPRSVSSRTSSSAS